MDSRARMPLITMWAWALLLLVAPAAVGDDCSCTAPDGSCNASITCKKGCIAVCASGGNCSAQCSGTGELIPPEDPAQDKPITKEPGETDRAAEKKSIFNAIWEALFG